MTEPSVVWGDIRLWCRHMLRRDLLAEVNINVAPLGFNVQKCIMLETPEHAAQHGITWSAILSPGRQLLFFQKLEISNLRPMVTFHRKWSAHV